MPWPSAALNMETTPEYLHTDEKDNAIDFLAMAARFRTEAEAEPARWKWVFIAAHGALYGFMVCALTRTNYENVCQYDQKEQKYTDRLIGFPEALKRVQSTNYICGYVDAAPLKVSTDQHKDIALLTNLLRNNFEHFTPKLWAIEMAGFPRILASAAELIEALAFKTGTVFWTETQANQIRDCLASIRRPATAITAQQHL